MTVMQRFKQFAIACDQLLHTLISLFLSDGGWADETLSARAYRSSADSKRWETVRRVIDGVFFWQDGHCRDAYEGEQQRVQMAPEYRPAINLVKAP